MGRVFNTEVLSGLFLAGLGLVGLIAIGRTEIGVLNDMGPGYLPRVLALLVTAGGSAMAAVGILRGGAALEKLHFKPLVLIGLASAAFGYAIDRLGMVIAVVALVALAALASRESRPVETVLLAAGIAIGAVLLFIVGLKMPAPIWPR
jgi:hypothetical protein